jgi:hypothetical protein
VRWSLAGNTGSYTTASWYRWLLDPLSKTSSQIVGKAFRSYCSFGVRDKSGEYVRLALDGAPFTPVKTGSYVLANAQGTKLGGSGYTLAATRLDDGAYTLTYGGSFLSVDDTTNAGRAWARACPSAPGRPSDPSGGSYPTAVAATGLWTAASALSIATLASRCLFRRLRRGRRHDTCEGMGCAE